jgi:hypothetical protein
MGVHLQWSHETDLTAETSSVSRARAFVSVHLLEHELAHLVDDIRLVVSELATNAIVHARTPFAVVLGAFETTLFVEVLDGSQVGPTLVVARALDTGGRGVAIVHALSRDWGASASASGGKSVWAEFDIGAPVHGSLGTQVARSTPAAVTA